MWCHWQLTSSGNYKSCVFIKLIKRLVNRLLCTINFKNISIVVTNFSRATYVSNKNCFTSWHINNTSTLSRYSLVGWAVWTLLTFRKLFHWLSWLDTYLLSVLQAFITMYIIFFNSQHNRPDKVFNKMLIEIRRFT